VIPPLELSKIDAQFLLGRAEFRRFLFAAIQSAGIIGITSPANGQSLRPLEWFEGRRSLGFDLLRMADAGQPEPLQSAEALATMSAAILEALNPPPKEKARGRRDDRDPDAADERYDDLP
jgi:hypothetical protein